MRRGEIEGLKWTDYRDGSLWVERSIWNGEAVEPKSKKSTAPVPVIRQLAERLELHRLRCGRDGWMFSTSNNTPLSFHNVVNRVILPALNRCRHCGQTEDHHQPHLLGDKKRCSGYERDERIPEWHGFHAGRRGLGSNLYRLGVPSLVIQKILRHSNVSTTEGYYIKSSGADVTSAMLKFEENLSLQATIRPPSSGSEEKSGFVN